MPAFINLQQYYAEEYLVDRARALEDRIELRWKHRVVGLERFADHVRLTIETPDGTYDLEAEYVLAADGCNSAIRGFLGLDFMGRVFEERFLITDVVTPVELPNERRFWFDPPFHNGQSALLHRQPDNMYRIDLQLGWDADPELEKRPERVIPRIEAVLGEHTPFEIEWVSVYTFQCRRLERFVHGRVIFIGDSAHVVSPFGARGGNGGIQDADNLVWKLALVLKGQAPAALLETYDEERGARGRREHSELEPLDQLHDAQERDRARVPGRRAGAGRGSAVRAPPGQLGAPLGALFACRHAPADAGRRRSRGRWRPGRPVPMRRSPAPTADPAGCSSTWAACSRSCALAMRARGRPICAASAICARS